MDTSLDKAVRQNWHAAGIAAIHHADRYLTELKAYASSIPASQLEMSGDDASSIIGFIDEVQLNPNIKDVYKVLVERVRISELQSGHSQEQKRAKAAARIAIDEEIEKHRTTILALENKRNAI